MTVFEQYKAKFNENQYKSIQFDGFDIGILMYNEKEQFYSAYFAYNSVFHVKTYDIDNALNLFWIVVNKYDKYKNKLIEYIKETEKWRLIT